MIRENNPHPNRTDKVLYELGGMVISAMLSDIEGFGELYDFYAKRYIDAFDFAKFDSRTQKKYAEQSRRIGIMRGPRLFPTEVDLRVE